MRAEAEAHLVALVAENIVFAGVLELLRIMVGRAKAHVDAHAGGHHHAFHFGIFRAQAREHRIGRAPT